jgi:enterochelin esterase-like enzyme
MNIVKIVSCMHNKKPFSTMKKLLTFFFLIIVNYLVAQMPIPVAGKIDRIENFKSKFVAARNIDIWLPEGYTKDKKYAVLYMQDGQGLYDANTTWNHQSWEVDDVLTKLIKEHAIKEVIVVGIWNGQASRHVEYFPQKPYDGLISIEKDTVTAQLQRASRTKDFFQPISDKYLQFLVTELKPFIDSSYSTYTNKSNTFVAGSSMGGLISMYAICEYPKVFGGAICMSTHWPGTFTTENNPMPNAFANYMREHLPNPKNHKIYFDYGDQTLDAMYPPLQKNIDIVIRSKGFTNKNWKTQFSPGDNHSEVSWSKRLPKAIQFLFGK